MSIQNNEYDHVDREIAKLLMEDATLTSASIGGLVGLSSSAANERVRKLKNDGAIKKIAAFMDSAFMNMKLGAFIFVLVEGKKHNIDFLKKVTAHDNVLECHHMTGEYSYIIKVRVVDTKALENFISDFLKGQAGVIKTITQIILSSPKEHSVIVS